MRAWEIPNWQNKKLRCKHWAEPFWIWLNPKTMEWEINWYTYTARQMLLKLMASDDVEEYVEPPIKTKDLTWTEAQRAWENGWEVEQMDGGGEYFGLEAEFTVEDIIVSKYKLTGNRRK